MSTLRFRLLCVIAIALVGGVVSQSAGAGRAVTGSPGTVSAARLAALSQSIGYHRAPAPSGLALASAPAGVRSAALSSLAAPSDFSKIGVDFGITVVTSVTWADYDSDGRLDLLAVGYDYDPESMNLPVAVTKLFRNNGDGTFSEDKTAGLPSLWGGVASWTDYDSDGRLDVLLAGCSDIFCESTVSKLFRNNGDGSFSEDARAGLIGVRAGNDMITWADYDSDGRPDLLLIGDSNSSLLVDGIGASVVIRSTLVTKLYHNNGDGSFSENTKAQFPGLIWGQSAWSDYDADGRPDLLLSGIADGADSEPVSKLYHNNGDGTFSENTATQLPGVAGGWIAWGDYDGDGFADILINGATQLTAGGSVTSAVIPSSPTKLYRNNGDGTFSEDTASGLPAMSDAQLVWGDYDGDGSLDVALNGCIEPCSESNYVTEIYRNNGNGSFTRDENAGLPASFAWLASGDYNSDGRLDLLVYSIDPWNVSGAPPTSAVYQNDGDPVAAPDSPLGLETHLMANGIVKFSWRESDSKTLTNSVSYNLRVGTTPGGGDIVSALAGPSGTRQLVAYGNEGGRTFAKKVIPPGTYYWSVQSVGANYAGSSFAPEHDFTIAPKVRIGLLRTQIFACTSGPRATKLFGKVSPSLFSAAVAVQIRFARGAGWRKVMAQRLSSSGTFSFAKVGKGMTRSFWVRVRVRSKLGTAVSRPTRVYVEDAAVCAAPARGATG